MSFIIVFITSFLISVLLTYVVIKLQKKYNFGQSVREDGPDSHQGKTGTPTIGGIAFVVSTVLVSTLLMKVNSHTVMLLIMLVGFGAVGLLDDLLIMVKKKNQGLTSLQKIFGQLVVSGLFLYALHNYSDGLSTSIIIPGLDNPVDLKWFYVVFAVFLIVGTANATNLTDGLDGLLSGTSVVAIMTMGSIAFMSGELTIAAFTIILSGAIIGFLLFNSYPASIFMGDTGSLAIGGTIAGLAILLKVELLLIIIGLVFVIETLSVIIQVASYKLRRKLVFRMTPIHHHYELKGNSETKIVNSMLIVSIIASGVSLLIFGKFY